MNLILIERDELDEANVIRLSDARASHIVNVLRAAPGQSVRIGLVDGSYGVAVVRALSRTHVECTCRFDADAPARQPVDLLLALPRPKVMRRLWAQIAALGVDCVMLTNAERVERNYFDTHVLDPLCYRPLLIEGLQQARDTRVPRVSIHRRFKVLVEDELETLAGPGTRLVAQPGVVSGVFESVRACDASRVLVAIGPEGGWNDFEIRLLVAHGFTPVGMGPRALRSDTATAAILSLVHEAMRSQ